MGKARQVPYMSEQEREEGEVEDWVDEFVQELRVLLMIRILLLHVTTTMLACFINYFRA